MPGLSSYDDSLLRGMPENAPDRCEWCGSKRDLKDIEDVGGLGEEDRLLTLCKPCRLSGGFETQED